MSEQRQVQGYRRLLESVKHILDNPEMQGVERAIQQAQDKLSAAGEFSREELETLGEYLRRDLHDAAEYMEENGREFADWLRLDILKLETWLAEAMLGLADQTRIELTEWALRSELHRWHSGEIAGPGVLQCIDCGEELHFTEPGHIPPCPRCHGSHFRRVPAD